MTKGILAITILALSTSAALAAHRTHHRHVTHAAAPAYPVAPMGGMSSGDQTQYMKNLRDSGYDPKNDYGKNGIIVSQ